VNEYTTDDQYGGKVALDPNGNFVVVWQSRQDGSAYGVFGRRFPSSVPVEVLLQDLIDFVTGLHPADFSKPIYQNALLNKLDALWVLIDSGDLSTTCQAIDKLQNDIIKKVDSVTPPPDWLIPGDARDEIYNKAVALVLALKGQADTLGGCP